MEMEEITHFSHEHSLILIKHPPPPALEEQSNDDEDICRCYGCKEPVLAEEEAYKCDRRWCETIFLHKQCAQLPREIMHPSHEQHSLILFPSPPFGRMGSGFCDVCRARLDGFNYYCSVCDFNLDLKCAVTEKEALFVYINKKFKHPSHEHLLVYQPRPTSFCCSACNVEDKDLSYQCSEYGCPFWIHKSCALLPNIAQRNDHVHPDTDERDNHILGTLQLIYKLPSEYLSFPFYCDVCGGNIRLMHWAYYCRQCRYFVHIKCMPSPKLRIGDDYLYDDDDATFEDRMLKLLLPVDFLHLPVVDESVEMIQRFLLRKNCLKNIQPMIEDFGHQHPLTLCCGNTEEDEDERIICDACISPISSTHYGCAECKFFLHLQCAELPAEFQHPSHPHPLTLGHFKRFYETFQCNICRVYSNGYYFECMSMGCEFRIDIKCACIQTMISHETHDHPLFHSIPDSTKICSACFNSDDQDLFGCEPCNFYLHLSCVMLPKKVGHRFDYHHRLELSFPPYPDHPEPFDCLECEEEADPNHWLYRCKECDLSFHPLSAAKYPNVKFDQNIQIDSHTHPLKFVQSASVKSPCHDCGSDMSSDAFECETCNFHLCTPCVSRIESKATNA